ncbi:hypothetical protein [Neobacillus sp. PS3-40]|uniref:hypothetical protein n=1 Tax=Neobacillus sp. PS3-40 TaxID=3070679 RepID=UPI0027E1511C|nr:hypothetical protein [Neobacillus sp. PS3-40]WML44929.1 hypothetical protein RCG20_03210 [Neobacillus sp. PS3-40]
MSFKNLFRSLWKNESETELILKLTVLETNLNNLKDQLSEMKEKVNLKNPEQTKDPPIIIERINIEKIVLDKYELNNNFGQLGIKELKGKLNIGATYGSDFTPNLDEENEEEQQKEKEKTRNVKARNSTGNGPNINIKAKSEI